MHNKLAKRIDSVNRRCVFSLRDIFLSLSMTVPIVEGALQAFLFL